ncbi:DNA/RNA non-specific endonuclease [Mariniblastus sp.]|nr:DNA/RNA non-specific endonuclease [Mariniblastus sp.]
MSDSGKNLEKILNVLKISARNFAERFIKDQKIRELYLKKIAQASQDIQVAVIKGKFTAQEGAKIASAVRNKILAASRLKLSDLGVSYSEFQKSKGTSFEKLQVKYSKRKFYRQFGELTKSQKDEVFLDVIEGAGKDSAKDTKFIRRLGKIGRVLSVISYGVAIYNITSAEDKLTAAAKEGTSFLGGTGGGAAGGASAGFICGPGAPICVALGVFIGGALGTLGVDLAWDFAETQAKPSKSNWRSSYHPLPDSRLLHGCNFTDRVCHNFPSRFESLAFGYGPNEIELTAKQLNEIESELFAASKSSMSSNDASAVEDFLPSESELTFNARQILTDYSHTSSVDIARGLDVEVPVSMPAEVFSPSKMRQAVSSPIQGADSVILNQKMEQLAQIRFKITEPRNVYAEKQKRALELVDQIAVVRKIKNEKEFQRQYFKFLRLRDKAEGRGSSTLVEPKSNQPRFLGSTASLRFGKVVGDVFGIDPVFGALLNPSGGIVGDGFNRIFPIPLPGLKKFNHPDYREDSIIMHGIYHDAAGYLRNFHDIGPGYDYLGEERNCDPRNPLVGQRSGLRWWLNNGSRRFRFKAKEQQTEFPIDRLSYELYSDAFEYYLTRKRVCNPDANDAYEDSLRISRDGEFGSNSIQESVGFESAPQELANISEVNKSEASSYFGNLVEPLSSNSPSPQPISQCNDAAQENPFSNFSFQDLKTYLEFGSHRDFPNLYEELSKTTQPLQLSAPINYAVQNHLDSSISSVKTRTNHSVSERDVTTSASVAQEPNNTLTLPDLGNSKLWNELKSSSMQAVGSIGDSAVAFSSRKADVFLGATVGEGWRATQTTGDPFSNIVKAIALARTMYLDGYIIRIGSEKLVKTVFEFVEGMWFLASEFVRRYAKGMREWGWLGGIGARYEVAKFVVTELLPGMVFGLWEQLKEWWSELGRAKDLIASGCEMAMKASVLADIDSAAKKLAEGMAILLVLAVSILIEIFGLKGIGKFLKVKPKLPIKVKPKVIDAKIGKPKRAQSPSMIDRAKLRTELSLKQADILTHDGKLTSKAVLDSKRIESVKEINNSKIIEQLTRDGSDVSDWAKHTTESTPLPDGDRMQVHFYKHKSGRIDYETPDFKVSKNIGSTKSNAQKILKDRLTIDEYRKTFPKSKLSDQDLQFKIDIGDRINPKTGRFNKRSAKKQSGSKVPKIQKVDVSDRFMAESFEKGNNRYQVAAMELGVPGKVKTHRKKSAQRSVSKGTGDDAGHLIGDQFGAPGGKQNLSLQNWKTNQGGSFAKLESSWARKLKKGIRVIVKVEDVYKEGASRPYMRRVTWTEIQKTGVKSNFKELFMNSTTEKGRISTGQKSLKAGSAKIYDITTGKRIK